MAGMNAREIFFFFFYIYIFRWWSSLSSYISSRAPFHRYMLKAATHIAREHSEHSIQSEIFIHTLFPLTSLLWRRSFFALLLLCGKNSFFSSSARLVFFFCVHRQRAKRVSTTQVIQIISSHLPLCARLVDKLCVHKLCALSRSLGAFGGMMGKTLPIFHAVSSSRRASFSFDNVAMSENLVGSK